MREFLLELYLEFGERAFGPTEDTAEMIENATMVGYIDRCYIPAGIPWGKLSFVLSAKGLEYLKNA